MMILPLAIFDIGYSEESGFKTCQTVSVCRVDNSCPFIKTCSFIFNSCQIKTILQYDLSLMAAILVSGSQRGVRGQTSY